MRISDWSSDVCSSDLSAFKLVILAELVREIAGGKRHWDDPITLDGGDLPGGFYADKAKGTIATIRDLATKMVSVSDNSATDILLHALGRDKVEAVLPVVGIKEPAGMRPFLSTLEMRSEEHTSELQSLMRTSYAVFCLTKNTKMW